MCVRAKCVFLEPFWGSSSKNNSLNIIHVCSCLLQMDYNAEVIVEKLTSQIFVGNVFVRVGILTPFNGYE